LAFTTGERLEASAGSRAAAARHGRGARRADGPDGDIDNILEILLGALSVATRRRGSSRVFPARQRGAAGLHVAALRGVDVEIVLPGRSNVPLMDWRRAAAVRAARERLPGLPGAAAFDTASCSSSTARGR